MTESCRCTEERTRLAAALAYVTRAHYVLQDLKPLIPLDIPTQLAFTQLQTQLAEEQEGLARYHARFHAQPD